MASGRSSSKKNILKVLFDIKPVTEGGVLDLKKINKVNETVDLSAYTLKSSLPKEENNGIEIEHKDEKESEIPQKINLAFSSKPLADSSKKEASKASLAEESVSCLGGLPSREEILQELEKFDLEEEMTQASFANKTVEGRNKKPAKRKIKNDNLSSKKLFLKKEQKKPEKSWEEISQDYFSIAGDNQRDKIYDLEKFYFHPDRIRKEPPCQIKTKTVKKEKREPLRQEEIDWELAEAEKGKSDLFTVQTAKIAKRPFTPAEENLFKKRLERNKAGSNFSLKETKKRKRGWLGFVFAGVIISLVIPVSAWLSKGLLIKENALSNSFSAYQGLMAAKNSLKEADWQGAENNFSSAHENFFKARQEINKLGQITLNIIDNLPGAEEVSSGNHLVKVGENLAKAGQHMSSAVGIFASENLFGLMSLPEKNDGHLLAVEEDHSLTDKIAEGRIGLINGLADIRLATKELGQVEVLSLPEDIREGVSFLKSDLPLVEEMLSQAADWSNAFLKILGHNNPRQYLLVFQNNSELRATGGFIGTYGLVTLDRGTISDLLIEGVFNADGQLHEKIIPPRPIQKVSTAWSMHDANWFADWPTSAEKIAWFYEKTGGPTVSGVISFTPTVAERILEITGPIAMPEYGVVLSADNFVELVQYEVEVDYDKELNQPKKILADFAPLFIDKINELSSEKKKQAFEIIFNALSEKHILAYFKDPALEQVMEKEGWAGKLLETEKDFLSVVSSNINGYKTDRVIEESIEHQTEIQEDGSIIDTLTVRRRHRGGNEDYEWWNRVNANYLRVYLPLGAELISVRGQTFENYQPPIDYQAYGFSQDPLVASIENKMIIDPSTNTRIAEENDKTVFGNWVYLSPGEEVVLVYKYKLPFKIDLTKSSDSYSLLVQKQLGSLENDFKHLMTFPQEWHVSWSYPDEWRPANGEAVWQGDLKRDRFLGAAFEL